MLNDGRTGRRKVTAIGPTRAGWGFHLHPAVIGAGEYLHRHARPQCADYRRAGVGTGPEGDRLYRRRDSLDWRRGALDRRRRARFVSVVVRLVVPHGGAAAGTSCCASARPIVSGTAVVSATTAVASAILLMGAPSGRDGGMPSPIF